ncbi:phage tail tube protein [Rugamonas sp. DEMB1]|uniref:phage tail tube protein n=1 Tax=Rugamonas sp. DEMB1 TaxID=3039386 RepID=UPI002447BF94|nr:phage tail tube protein [Rugamonas sp. DEMB1]WGG51828.1 phage tail tube protein [Rugamonas sp. DEMB1]
MAYNFPEGSSQQFSQTFAAAKTITALTNADPAIATSVAHGYTSGDELLFNIGWEDATDTVFKVTVLTADTYSIDGLDASDVNFFPAGSGVGTTQKISTWIAIPQVLTIGSSGGDPKFTDVNPLAKRNGIKIPTGFNATSVTLSLGHDASNANYKTMVKISRALKKVAFKQVLNGGAVTYGYGYMSVSEMPKLNNNQVNTVDAALALLGRSISY